MNEQPIQNLQQRLHYYRKSKRYWLTREVPTFLLVGSLIGLIISYCVASLEPAVPDYLFVEGLDIGCLLAMAPIGIQRPKKPTQLQVDEDVALRKAFGLNAAVSDETPRKEDCPPNKDNPPRVFFCF